MSKILYVSSADPLRGPGVVSMNHYRMLKDAGFEVDFLTLMKVEGFPEIKYVYEKNPPKWHNLKYKLYKKLIKCDTSNNHQFFYLKETNPPVPIRRILKLISNDYDVIIIYFWVNMLSYKTISEIYNHCAKKPKVIFLCADYSPMTGGCHFVDNCINYKSGCGNCPMLYSKNPNDFTAKNVQYRKRVIKQIQPYVRMNNYMSSFFKESDVMRAGANIIISSTIINHNIFIPYDVKEVRKQFEISSDYDFVILFGCQSLNNTRKGMVYLIDALDILYKNLSEKDRNRILLVSIGDDDKSLDQMFKFKRKHLGYVNVSDLPKIYSLANVFVSPSINDAGPTMVNQSIACGTPVVAFEIGSALDVVKDKGTGITVPLMDSIGISQAIESIFRMDMKSYNSLRLKCREVSLQLQSRSTLIDFIKSIL